MSVSSFASQRESHTTSNTSLLDHSSTGRVAVAAKALHRYLNPVSPLYMKIPIQDGFNWRETFAGLAPGEWYLVVFRSRHRADADRQLLTEHDDRAHEAAKAMPGFVHYFAGSPAEDDRACMSFCLWENQTYAQAASAHQHHRAAVQVADVMYDYFQLERYVVRNLPDGAVTFTALPGYSHTS